MRSAQFSEFCVIECLRAEAGPINSQTPKGTKLLMVHTSRIYFERDLRRRSDREMVVQARENAVQLRRCQQRRRAAAKVNRIRMRAVITRRSYFCNQCANISLS